MNFLTCTPRQTLLELSNQGQYDGQGMEHTWKKRVYTGFLGKPEGKRQIRDLDVDVRIILK
jgi:hypothetical protein